jgi:hypothetical protein
LPARTIAALICHYAKDFLYTWPRLSIRRIHPDRFPVATIRM